MQQNNKNNHRSDSGSLNIIVLFFIFILGFQYAQAQDVVRERLQSHLEYLASEELEGRKPGTEGCRQAAEYIRDTFRAYGLELAADEGFDYFEVFTAAKAGKGNMLVAGDIAGNCEIDFLPFSFSSNDRLQAPLVFAGYGFDYQGDSLQWDDYAGFDVKNKWLLVFMGVPGLGDNNPLDNFSSERDKALLASDKGAGGIIFVAPPTLSEKDKLNGVLFDKSSARANIPVLQINRALANQLLAASGTTVASLEKRINEDGNIKPFVCQSELDAASFVEFERVNTANVIAILPGSEADKDSSYILCGAHYDHLGMGGPGSGSRMPDTNAVHYGADDNASGVAAVLELARYFSTKENAPKRSMVFMAFGAEEMGLLGSAHYTANPLLPLDKCLAMVNFDMVGRLDPEKRTIIIGGTGTSEEAVGLLDKAGESHMLNASYSAAGYGASDHSSFYVKNIPVFFISSGAHQDYHTPFDDVGHINYEGMADIIAYSATLMQKLDGFSGRLNFKEAGPKNKKRHGYKFKVTLGIMPDFASQDNNGLGVSAVSKDGPAWNGGMLKGDRIIAINGMEVTNIYSYMSRLKDLKAGETAIVDVVREGKKQVLLIQL